jgi:hypothetical protein
MTQRRVALALAFGIVVLAITGASGRQRGAAPPAPGGAPPLGPATGTGLIVGRVLDADGDKPMQGASVFLTPLGAAPGGPGAIGPRPQTVVTGNDGVYMFRNLPRGTFAIGGALTGYLFQAGLGGGPATVTLADGEKVNDVVLRLWRFGAISGQVVDEQGEGVEGITISVVHGDTAGGRRTLGVQQTGVTDDRGVYRITGLAPGDYGACALFSRHIAPAAAAAAMMTGDNVEMQRSMSGSGGLSPSGSGYRVGEFVMISSSGSRNVDPSPGEDGRLSVFADACYSSAPNLQGAQLVRVTSGQERSALNLVLRIVPSVRVSGVLTGPAHRIAGMGVHLYPAVPGESSITNAIEAANTLTDLTGAFGFIGVPAGSYVVRVVYTPAAQFEESFPQQMLDDLIARGIAVPAEFMNRAPSQAPTEPALWATAPINVGDSDVNGVSLVLREAFRVSGRLVFEGTQPHPAIDRMAMATLNFESLDPVGSSTYAQARGRVAADGTFSAPTVVPGRYLLTMQGGWPGWTVKSIVANGRDLFDDPLDVTGGDVTGVVVTLTDRPSELSGTVRNDSGVFDVRARVLIFPAERARWTQTSGGRRLSNQAVSKDGTFSARGLPAGEYLVVAVGSQAIVNWQDPRTLDALSRVASRATVRDGERRSIDLVTSVIR